MAFLVTTLFLALALTLPLVGFVLLILIISEVKLKAINDGGTKDENNIWC